MAAPPSRARRKEQRGGSFHALWSSFPRAAASRGEVQNLPSTAKEAATASAAAQANCQTGMGRSMRPPTPWAAAGIAAAKSTAPAADTIAAQRLIRTPSSGSGGCAKPSSSTSNTPGIEASNRSSPAPSSKWTNRSYPCTCTSSWLLPLTRRVTTSPRFTGTCRGPALELPVDDLQIDHRPVGFGFSARLGTAPVLIVLLRKGRGSRRRGGSGTRVRGCRCRTAVSAPAGWSSCCLRNLPVPGGLSPPSWIPPASIPPSWIQAGGPALIRPRPRAGRSVRFVRRRARPGCRRPSMATARGGSTERSSSTRIGSEVRRWSCRWGRGNRKSPSGAGGRLQHLAVVGAEQERLHGGQVAVHLQHYPTHRFAVPPGCCMRRPESAPTPPGPRPAILMTSCAVPAPAPPALLVGVPTEPEHRDGAPQDGASAQLHDQAGQGLIGDGVDVPQAGRLGEARYSGSLPKVRKEAGMVEAANGRTGTACGAEGSSASVRGPDSAPGSTSPKRRPAAVRG